VRTPTPADVRANERLDQVRRKQRSPSWPGFPSPWMSRETCDACCGPLAYTGVNFAVRSGTEVRCGPCATEEK